MSELFVVTDPRPRRRDRTRDGTAPPLHPPVSPLGASSSSASHSQSQSASTDSLVPPSLLHGRGVSVVNEVTDRELFAAAAAVVPNLQTLLTRRIAASRRRDSSSSSSSSAHRGFSSSTGPGMLTASGKSSLHWVVKKKRHGLEIKEFDRGSLAHATVAAPSRSSNASQTPRTPAAPVSRTTLRTPRWCQFNRAASAYPEHAPSSRPSFASARDSFSTSNRASLPRYPHQQQTWPYCDKRVAFAASAHAELGCRLSEALELLYSTDGLQFDATMSSIFGHSNYKRGDQLLAHALPQGLGVTLSDLDELAGNACAATGSRSGSAFDWLERDDSLVEPTQPGWVALQSVTLRPRLNTSLSTAALRKHKLSFAAYSQTRPARDEAVYVMRTLPRELQMRVNATSEFTEAGDGVVAGSGEDNADEISVGYHLAGSYSDLSGHQTRITMCAYVTTPPVDAAGSHDGGFEHDDDGETGAHHSFLARHQHNRQLRRRSECSTSAKYVVSLLAAATNDLEKLLRRRRLGSQAFILTPLDKSVFQQHDCRVCARRFGLLRAELFCQLCGHLVCRDCSRKFEVEPVARRVRRNRVCFTCVAHVDASGAVKDESEDVHEFWTQPRHRSRRERQGSGKRSGRRAAEEDGRVPAFLSARAGRSAAAASSMWNVFKTPDRDTGEGAAAGIDAPGSRRVRRAFSMDHADAGAGYGDVNDVDDLVDVDDDRHLGSTIDLLTRRRRRAGSNDSMTALQGTDLNGSTTPPLTPGRQLADALFSGNPLSRARALEVVRRVLQQVTQHSDESTLGDEGLGSDACETDLQQQAAFSSSSVLSAPDSAMLRKYLEARRRLSSISSWKAGTDGAATDGRCSSVPMPVLDESKPKKDVADSMSKLPPACAAAAAPLESKKKAKGSKRVDLLSRPWEFRSNAARPLARSQTYMSSATETEDDEEEVEDASFTLPGLSVAPLSSLDGVCEVAAARLNCPMAYVVSLNHSHSNAGIVGAFEASSVRHALSDRTTALCSVASTTLLSSWDPVVVPSPLTDPAFHQLGEDAGMRFFAAFPIRVSPNDGEKEWGGAPVAWLCAADSAPRDCVTLEDYAAMQALAKLVADLLGQKPPPAQHA